MARKSRKRKSRPHANTATPRRDATTAVLEGAACAPNTPSETEQSDLAELSLAQEELSQPLAVAPECDPSEQESLPVVNLDPSPETVTDDTVNDDVVSDDISSDDTEPQPIALDVEASTSPQSDAILHAIDDNTSLLRQLLADFADLQNNVVEATSASSQHGVMIVESDGVSQSEHEIAIESLRDEIANLEDELGELRRQNSDLASKVASASVRKSTSDTPSDFTEALSWEERKKLILRQMEDDCFDAETFLTQTVQSRLNEVNSEDEAACEVDPVSFVEQLTAELTRLQQQNERFEKEIGELNHLLENRPQSGAGGMAIGAAAIAEMIDADELIQEERQRLQTLQTQWEEKFRQAEIDASLERAKLSRERQEVANKMADLEERLDRIRRDAVQTQSGEGHSRKWLAKLGLAGDD